MVVHSSILVLWTKESGEPQSMGAQRVRHDGLTNTFTSLQFCGLVHGLSWRMSLMHLGKKKVYSAVFRYSFLWISIKSNCSIIII